MTIDLSLGSRAIVAETLPLMKQHRAALEDALARYMANHGPHDPSAGHSNAWTRAIVDLLLDHAGKLGGASSPSTIGDAVQHRRTPALGGEHYSSVGDALKPVMKDVLGAQATPPVIAAWGDAYWAIVRMLFRRESRLAA